MGHKIEHNLNKDSQDATVSPFTLVFEKGSLDAVAQIMNVVILITVSYYTGYSKPGSISYLLHVGVVLC